MDRSTKTIKLSNCEVIIYSFLTWGEKEKLQLELMKGAKLNEQGLQDYDVQATLEVKYKTLETLIKEIKEGGEVRKFTRDWMDNLSVNDGDKLYDEINNLGKKKQ